MNDLTMPREKGFNSFPFVYLTFVVPNSLFVCVDFLCPTQQFFSHVEMGLPRLLSSGYGVLLKDTTK